TIAPMTAADRVSVIALFWRSHSRASQGLIRIGGSLSFRVDTFFAAMVKPRSQQARINQVTLSGCHPLANRTRPKKCEFPCPQSRRRLKCGDTQTEVAM